MPWHMKPAGNGKVFVVDDKGKKYSDKPIPKWRAKKQMAALYQAEPEKKQEGGLYVGGSFSNSQTPVINITGPGSNFSFWNGEHWLPLEKAAPMKSEGDGEHPSSHYLVVENAFKPTTWHLRVRGKDGKPDHTLMGGAWAALHGGYRGNKYEGPGKAQAIADLKKLYAGEDMTPPGEKGFRVFKQADGAYRWVTISSSAFRDRDGEIVTIKALADNVDRLDLKGDYGPLRWWHLGGWEAPDGKERWDTWKAGIGLDLGICDFCMLHGKMLIESGTFKTPELGEAFSKAQKNVEVSIGFSHPRDEPIEKEYQNINIFERSLLPSGMASNLLTNMIVKGENQMDFKQKFDALRAILRNDTDLAQKILSNAEAIQKAAEESGLEYKEVADMLTTSAESETEEVIQSPPVEEPEAKKPEEETPVEEVPATEAKAAPPPPPAEPEPEEIGDWTPQQLAEFCAKVYQQMMGKKEAEAELKQAGRDQILSDALVSLKAMGERFTATEKALEETKQSLLELTDARPVGIKQLQSMRPTERADNVIKGAAPTGPQMDPDFVKFALGGK